MGLFLTTSKTVWKNSASRSSSGYSCLHTAFTIKFEAFAVKLYMILSSATLDEEGDGMLRVLENLTNL